MQTPELAYIGLGSNLQDPLSQLRRALRALQTLPNTTLIACSSAYQNPAIGPGQQPDYINAVAALRTALNAEELLAHLQSIETAQGRERLEHWGARTLDLDLLLYGDNIIQSATLTVPHPRMQERAFVLYPLHELNPALLLPGGTALTDMIATLGAVADNMTIHKFARLITPGSTA